MISGMEKILVSACLLGDRCTYKGDHNEQAYFAELNRFYDIVPFCPEVEGGLPTPRTPAERRGLFVVREDGTDVTNEFRTGAFKATQICQYLGIRLAILKENSPSCGVEQVYDGKFHNVLVKGEGITTEALRRIGVTVLNEEQGLNHLEELKRQQQIKDERTRIAIAREQAQSQQPEAEEKPERPHPPVRGYQGKPTRKPGPGQGKPFKKRPYGQKPDQGKPFKKKPYGQSGGPRKPFKKKPDRD